MVTEVIIRRDPTDPVVRIRGVLANKRKLLKQIGAVMESVSQKAFLDQRLGSIAWEPRYPNQGDPFVNLAGALADFSSGRRMPKSRRFDRRPALFDTGALAGSIHSRIVGEDTVETGSTLDYASAHQFGEETQQEVSNEAKRLIRAWIRTPRGRPYADRFQLMTKENTRFWTTQLVARPFVGVTPWGARTIQTIVEHSLKEDLEGG